MGVIVAAPLDIVHNLFEGGSKTRVVATIVLTALVVVANCYSDTSVYNCGDLFWEDESTNNTSLPLTNTTNSSINATTFNGTTDEPSRIGDHVLHSFFDSYQLSSRALVQNLPLLNGLYVGVLVTIVLHAGLFYWQMWKPFKDNEEKKERDKEGEEEVELKDKEIEGGDVAEEMTISSCQ